MKKRTRTAATTFLMVVVVGVAIVSALVFPASAADITPSGHWIDNLGAGVTAAEFGKGNDSPDCQSPRFRNGNVDLWVFEVRGASNPASKPVWDGAVPAWTTGGDLTVVDVTAEYGGYLPDTTTKRLYLETSPPGARLNAARLMYTGTSDSEVLARTCAHVLDIRLKGELSSSYDLSFRWTIDVDVSWTATEAYAFDIAYSATRNRASVPAIQPGSVRVTGSLQLGDPDLPVESIEVGYIVRDHRQDCPVDPLTFWFSCAIDESLLTIDPSTGRPVDVGFISTTALTPAGTATGRFPVDWRTVPPSHVFRTSAMIRNHQAMVSHKEVQVAKYTATNFFQETWRPGSNYCSTQTQTFELITAPPTTTTDEDRTTSTLTWCRPRPGYSLQYLGGPYGIPMLIANDDLRFSYPSALADLPPLTTREEVRTFLDSIACINSCAGLFKAQFLTAAFNALDPSFAQQSILIRGSCLTVADYLRQVDNEASRMKETDRIVRKAELERINGALVTTCPTVSTNTNNPTGIAPS